MPNMTNGTPSFKKPMVRITIFRVMFAGIGLWYGGISIRISGILPGMILFRTKPKAKYPTKRYAMIKPKYSGTTSCMIPICALQGINTARSVIIMNRCLLVSRIRVASTPGTLHPRLKMEGTMAYPCSPILWRKVSISTASRAMYPMSSRRESMK